jgi:hypothetical protein
MQQKIIENKSFYIDIFLWINGYSFFSAEKWNVFYVNVRYDYLQ